MNNRWVPIHTTLYDHLISGRLEPKQFVALLRLHDLADYKSGIWNGSSHALAAALGPAYTQRYAKMLLNTLEKGGFIKRFRSPAQRGNYEIAVADYKVMSGPYANKFVVLGNARCEEDLIYEARGAEPVKESPVQSAPTVALHPDVAKLEQLFTDADKTVHPASRAAMSKFLTEEKYDLSFITGMLSFAFATEFWSERIMKWEGFEQFYRKGTLGKQYNAWRKKTKKAAPAPVPTPTPAVSAAKKPDGRTDFHKAFEFGKNKKKDEVAEEKPHGKTNFLETFDFDKPAAPEPDEKQPLGIANFLQPNWLVIEEDDEDEDMAFLRRGEQMAAGH